MNKRKVAIFIDDFSATGVVVNALGIARELQSRGASVHFVATRAAGTFLSKVPSGIPVTQLLPADADESSRRDRLRGSIKAYRKFIKDFGADVVFSAGNQGHMVTLLAAMGRRGIRTILRISNEMERGARGGRGSTVIAWFRLIKFRWVAARADRLVFVSEQLRQNWAKVGQIGAKATVIPNGVDVEAVRRRAAEACSHPWLNDPQIPVVLGIGRLTEQKNFSTLIEAVATAAKEMPLRLMLIGTGPQREMLLEKASAAGLSESVDIILPVANPMPYMAAAAVLALPSRWEGASNVLLEALACGTPVLASRTAGSAEQVLDHGRFGVLVDPGDSRAMARALLKQVGPAAVVPGDRALDFSIASTMDSYADLIINAA